MDAGRHSFSPSIAQLADSKISQLGVHWSPNTYLARDDVFFDYLQWKKICLHAKLRGHGAELQLRWNASGWHRAIIPNRSTPCSRALSQSLPHDVIGGQPLKYHRTDNRQFVLYSVGWNGTDDGGKVFTKYSSNGSIDLEKGDWVWTCEVITIQK